MQVNILEAKNRLSQLLKSVQAGEEVIIANRSPSPASPATRYRLLRPRRRSESRRGDVVGWMRTSIRCRRMRGAVRKRSTRRCARSARPGYEPRTGRTVIYVDSSLVVYAFESQTLFGERVTRRWPRDRGAPGHRRWSSSNAWRRPSKSGNLVLQRYYEEGLNQFMVLPLPEAAYLQAAQLRGRFQMSMADAIHLACAQHRLLGPVDARRPAGRGVARPGGQRPRRIGLTPGPAGQPPGRRQVGLLQERCSSVLGGHQRRSRHTLQRPIDGQVGVVPADRALAIARVDVGGLVEEVRVVVESQEPVGKAFRIHSWRRLAASSSTPTH